MGSKRTVVLQCLAPQSASVLDIAWVTAENRVWLLSIISCVEQFCGRSSCHHVTLRVGSFTVLVELRGIVYLMSNRAREHSEKTKSYSAPGLSPGL